MTNPNDVAHSFVAMAKAYEELPRIQAQYDQAQTMIEAYAKQVQSVEMKLLVRNEEIETHLATIRRLEVERDDAEMRFLEADEKASRAVRVLGDLAGYATDARNDLSPPKAEPIPTPPAEPEVVHQSPWEGSGGGMSQPIPYNEPILAREHLADWAQGKSEVDPTATGHDVPASPTTESQSVTTEADSSEVPTSPTDPTSARPAPTGTGMEQGRSGSEPSSEWAGKSYWKDCPTYMPLDEWLSKGGTEYDYYKRS